MSAPMPLSLTMLGLQPGDIPRVRLTFDAPAGVDDLMRIAHYYTGIGLGVQARMLDDHTCEVILG